ncbi:MAG: 4Fe-4S binding protein [Candidatus Omnitrophota bacterium]
MPGFQTKEDSRRLKQLSMAVVFIGIIIGGWFFPLIGLLIPVCMVLALLIGLRNGRKWCDWMCPRGSFFDAILRIVSPRKKIPALFKRFPFRLVVLLALMAMMVSRLLQYWPDPYAIGIFFVRLLSVITMIGVALGVIFHQRAWCSFCPIGTLAGWLGPASRKLTIDSRLCVECKLCHKVCPTQVNPLAFKKDATEVVRDRDCLKCGLCLAACPTDALAFARKKTGEKEPGPSTRKMPG